MGTEEKQMNTFDAYVRDFITLYFDLHDKRAPWIAMAAHDDPIMSDEASVRYLEAVVLKDLKEQGCPWQLMRKAHCQASRAHLVPPIRHDFENENRLDRRDYIVHLKQLLATMLENYDDASTQVKTLSGDSGPIPQSSRNSSSWKAF